MAQSVKPLNLDFSSGHDLTVAPEIECGNLCGILSLPPSLPFLCSYVLSLPLSLSLKINLKKEKDLIIYYWKVSKSCNSRALLLRYAKSNSCEVTAACDSLVEMQNMLHLRSTESGPSLSQDSQGTFPLKIKKHCSRALILIYDFIASILFLFRS